MREIKQLEEAYVEAANALTTYRDKNGFKPGARVKTYFGEFGVIPPYGETWIGVDRMNVPVVMENGRRVQPWQMSDLTIIPASASS